MGDADMEEEAEAEAEEGGGVALRSGGVREKRILGGGKARERERGERALHSDRRGKGKKRKKRRHENGGREGGRRGKGTKITRGG